MATYVMYSQLPPWSCDVNGAAANETAITARAQTQYWIQMYSYSLLFRGFAQISQSSLSSSQSLIHPFTINDIVIFTIRIHTPLLSQP